MQHHQRCLSRLKPFAPLLLFRFLLLLFCGTFVLVHFKVSGSGLFSERASEVAGMCGGVASLTPPDAGSASSPAELPQPRAPAPHLL